MKTKKDLIKNLKERYKIIGLHSLIVPKLVDIFFEELTKIILNDNCRIMEFGTFKHSEVAARTGRNLQTGEDMELKATKKIIFKPSKLIKDKLNNRL